MALGIRKICTFLEETHIEGGKDALRPLNIIVVAAVIKNPWAGKGFIDNLRPAIIEITGPLSEEMTRRLLALMPAEQIEALIPLGADIKERHGITRGDVVGHSDIAPARKRDPGELCPWHSLARLRLALPVDAGAQLH